ncbi:MAG TPA: 2-dehydro-3-deoxy-6-phosphogalactonate aldolase [Micavibrio sp.]|jgi:2-dehydro-3-deoxyphosphogalactonate aldolase
MKAPDVEHYLKDSPLIAIMRGVKPDEILDYADVIVKAGWNCIEIPLNSPDPLESVRRLKDRYGDDILIGAGTVLSVAAVESVGDAGGRLIVAPNMDPDVIGEALKRNMAIMPGFLSSTEAFDAYRAGARYLKLFPADSMGPAYIKAIRSVLPPDAKIIPVGGVTPETIGSFRSAGSAAFGVGSQLYKPGMSVDAVGRQALKFMEACRTL